jgi:hypothetical protein
VCQVANLKGLKVFKPGNSVAQHVGPARFKN